MASLLSPAMAQSMVLRSIQRPRFLVPLHRSFSRLFSPCAATSNKRFNSKLSPLVLRRRIRHAIAASSVEGEEAELSDVTVEEEEEAELSDGTVEEEEEEAELSDGTVEEEEMVEIEATPEELEYISEIQRILEILKEKRDMTFGEVKLTIMIEDPRDIERKRLLGIEDPDEVTKDDLADALDDVHEGRVPENRVALKLLAKELSEWPELEVEAPKKKSKPSKSLYAKATDTGIDPETAAKRLNIDWDTAADIDDEEKGDDDEVPSVVGYGALYLVTAFPILIGIAVVLILFYNSLQ